jgi:hypothetical protein
MAGIWIRLCLLLDIWSMKLFVWMLGEHGELLDSHLFYFDRYSELAYHHRRNGRIAKADRLAAIAAAHFELAPDDDEPPKKAAAMGMPIPQPPLDTNAVSTVRIPRRPDTPSDLIDSPAL